MYLGRIVEKGGKSRELYRNPKHPYTDLAAQRRPRGPNPAPPNESAASVLPGEVPSPKQSALRVARFHPRCPLTREAASGANRIRDGGKSPAGGRPVRR